MEDGVEERAIEAPPSRGRHIRKRALRNKALSITFDEKDLRNYVTGFHKRKKKRRKEARKQQEEAQRRKRIEERKKRRLERDIALYGGAPPAADSTADGSDEDEYDDEDEDSELVASVSGTTTYDNGDLKVTVTTSEISREDKAFPNGRIGERAVPQSVTAQRKHSVPVTKKKPFKRVARNKSRPQSQNRKDKNKGKKEGKKGR